MNELMRDESEQNCCSARERTEQFVYLGHHRGRNGQPLGLTVIRHEFHHDGFTRANDQPIQLALFVIRFSGQLVCHVVHRLL